MINFKRCLSLVSSALLICASSALAASPGAATPRPPASVGSRAPSDKPLTDSDVEKATVGADIPADSALGGPGHTLDGGAVLTTAAAPPVKPAFDMTKLPFNKDSIRRIMITHVDEMRQCYVESLATKYGHRAEAMNGKLMTTFVISSSGHVKSAGVIKERTTVMDPQMRRCIVHILTGLRFPPPNDHRDHPIQFPYQLKVNP